jgi:UPF0716 protein FxsA
MRTRLFLVFLLVPIVELLLLIRIGTLIGFLATSALIMITAGAGALLLRSQGGRVLKEIQAELRSGRMPAGHLLDGLLILIGGIVLLTPGFLTDLAGLLLLFPPTRQRFKRLLRRRMERLVGRGRFSLFTLLP